MLIPNFVSYTLKKQKSQQIQGKRQPKSYLFLLPFYCFLLTLFAGGCVVVLDSSKTPKEEPTQPVTTTAPESASKPLTATEFAALEQSIHDQVNQYRASQKLPPLKLDPRISEVCRQHSKGMASEGVPFGHEGFEQRANAIEKSIAYRSVAENVAYNFGYSNPGKQAVEGWIKSPGHQKNMVGDFDLTGIGIVKNAKGEYYFTQIFVRRQ
ncbi:CAP domain-containing protein [Microcoleus sp. FACHB-672]|nr:CAP domain-containing protein [Microcoleus sp. FACHB-672]